MPDKRDGLPLPKEVGDIYLAEILGELRGMDQRLERIESKLGADSPESKEIVHIKEPDKPKLSESV
jgi:hypothetical protein